MSNAALVCISLMLIGSVFTTAYGIVKQTSQMKVGIVSYVLAKHQAQQTNYRRPAIVAGNSQR